MEGAPDVYPAYGDHPGTWQPSILDSIQFIEVEFDKPIYVTSIDIYETYNAGGVKSIFGRSVQGQWYLLWGTEQVQRIRHARIFSPILEKIDIRIHQIRLEIDCVALGARVAIDAIRLEGTGTKTGM